MSLVHLQDSLTSHVSDFVIRVNHYSSISIINYCDKSVEKTLMNC